MATYARRTRRNTIELLPGQSRYYRLPPMSNGDIDINATVSPLLGSNVRKAKAAKTKQISGFRVSSISVQDGIGVSDPLDPTGGTDIPPSSPATDITMELFHGASLVGTDTNHIASRIDAYDDTRYLKITRKEWGDTNSQAYSIEVTYPSQLPIRERKIPFGFFRKGFEENWNQNPYILQFKLDNKTITFYFDKKFAALYGIDNPLLVNLDDIDKTGFGGFRDINSTSILFRANAAHVLENRANELPYFSLNIHCEDNGPEELDVWGVDPDLKNISFEFRFYLAEIGGNLSIIAKDYSRTIDSISDNVPGYDVRYEIKKSLEDKLNHFANSRKIGEHLTPWLLGEHREIHRFFYNRPTDEIVIEYVGDMSQQSYAQWVPLPITEKKQQKRADVAFIEPSLMNLELQAELANAPRLFDLPLETPKPPTKPSRGNWYSNDGGNLKDKFDHIVVLMLENRSFDQVLGYLSREGGRADVDGLPPVGSPQAEKIFNEYGGRSYKPQPATDTAWFGYNIPGPAHEHESVVSQMSDGMAHFVSNFAKRMEGISSQEQLKQRLQRIMDYYPPSMLPTYAAMARNFAICDHWFCSHVGPTWPNRFITFSGDLNRDAQGEPELNNPKFSTMTPIEKLTFFDHLKAPYTWRCYEHGYSFIRLYTKYTFDMTNVVSFNDPVRGFFADAKNGTLPNVSFIEPDYIDLPPGNDDHPPANMADGQHLVASITKALLESRQWDRTLFVVTYDEHGGFYDHMVPPEAAPLLGLPQFKQLGPRVPAFVMSPYVPEGSVSNKIYDHTSIAATILRRFCSPNVPSMGMRADTANDLGSLLTLKTARPRTEFNQYISELTTMINARKAHLRTRSRELKVTDEADDFHGLLLFSRMITGSAP